MAIKLVSVSPAQEELIVKAIALGDRYTKTLGLLTPPAYEKAAEDGGLLVAVEAGEVIGYALFGLPKRSARIRLAHLCVAEEERGAGNCGPSGGGHQGAVSTTPWDQGQVPSGL